MAGGPGQGREGGLDKWNSHVCPGRVFSNLNDSVEWSASTEIVTMAITLMAAGYLCETVLFKARLLV